MAVASLGKYYDQVMAGRVFIGSTVAAGTALPITTGTAMTFGLWNVSNTMNAVLLHIAIGYTSGTIALGEFGLINTMGGDSIATGGPISAFTDGALGTTYRNALLGRGNATAMRFTPSAATIVASSACAWLGKSIESATAGLGIFSADIDLDGRIIVPPGQAVFLGGSVAQTALFSCSLTWAEVPA